MGLICVCPCCFLTLYQQKAAHDARPGEGTLSKKHQPLWCKCDSATFASFSVQWPRLNYDKFGSGFDSWYDAKNGWNCEECPTCTGREGKVCYASWTTFAMNGGGAGQSDGAGITEAKFNEYAAFLVDKAGRTQ